VDSVAERVEAPLAQPTLPARAPAEPAAPGRLRAAWLALERLRWPLLVYLGSRVLVVAVAVIDGALRHHNLTHELANWDGLWYRRLADHGYPTYASHAQTTLGFFPLYPLVTWLVAQVIHGWSTHSFLWCVTVAGVVVSSIGGLVATVLVYRLGTGWWGEQSGRRATLFFCLFPGSVVFSMVYAEGLMIPLAAGCILALQRRRWLLAGVLAGLATATEPEAAILIVVCAVSAARELRGRGWIDARARRSLLAPLLSLTGVVAFATFLWSWTGTPFASLVAQRDGWGERTDPFALVHLTTSLAGEISLSHFNHPTINLNLVVGLVGAIVLVVMVVLLLRARRLVSVEAIVWTLGIAFLSVTSEFTPPNPRMLITAFPAVMVVGHYVRGRTFTALAWATGALLAGTSALTFIGTTLRP
jgi:mannosyltransferase PIG-V